MLNPRISGRFWPQILVDYRLLSSTTSVTTTNNEIPVIKLPKYMENHLGQHLYREHRKSNLITKKRQKSINSTTTANSLNPKHLRQKVISWTGGDKKLFHYYGQRYSLANQADLPLISKFFLKETSNGHCMIVHNLNETNNPSLVNNQGITFESLGLNPKLIESIHELLSNGHPNTKIQPSTIQSAVIPLIIQHKNVLFSSETGSGKTLAYLAPIIQLIDRNKASNQQNQVKRRSKHPYGLIVTPSRELCEQIGTVAHCLTRNSSVGVATMIGGLPKHLTHTGNDLIITTIGMIESHLNTGVYSLRSLNHLVLDEADTLLDDSFAYETMDILGSLNINHGQNSEETADQPQQQPHQLNGTQLICCSATMPTTIDSTIGSLIDLTTDIDQISTNHLHMLRTNVKHRFFRVNRHKKHLKLLELLFECRSRRQSVIIFANRIDCIDWLYKFLNENSFPCLRLTSRMDEEERYESFRLFQQNQDYQILISTDIGSRGLDTKHVQHVINYDCPHFVSDYIHRSGRTGRLGSDRIGYVSTLISYKPDAYMLMDLERSIRLNRPIATVNANIKSQLSQNRMDKWKKYQRNLDK